MATGEKHKETGFDAQRVAHELGVLLPPQVAYGEPLTRMVNDVAKAHEDQHDTEGAMSLLSISLSYPSEVDYNLAQLDSAKKYLVLDFMPYDIETDDVLMRHEASAIHTSVLQLQLSLACMLSAIRSGAIDRPDHIIGIPNPNMRRFVNTFLGFHDDVRGISRHKRTAVEATYESFEEATQRYVTKERIEKTFARVQAEYARRHLL